MYWSGIPGKAAVGLGAVAVPVVFAVAGAGQASAGPAICVSGPFGYAYACVETPGWVGWYGPGWDRGWDNGGHGHGNGHGNGNGNGNGNGHGAWEWND